MKNILACGAVLCHLAGVLGGFGLILADRGRRDTSWEGLELEMGMGIRIRRLTAPQFLVSRAARGAQRGQSSR